MKDQRSTVALRRSLSEAEIDLDKIFHSGIEVVIPAAGPIIVGLTEDSNMGSKPILHKLERHGLDRRAMRRACRRNPSKMARNLPQNQ